MIVRRLLVLCIMAILANAQDPRDNRDYPFQIKEPFAFGKLPAGTAYVTGPAKGEKALSEIALSSDLKHVAVSVYDTSSDDQAYFLDGKEIGRAKAAHPPIGLSPDGKTVIHAAGSSSAKVYLNDKVILDDVTTLDRISFSHNGTHYILSGCKGEKTWFVCVDGKTIDVPGPSFESVLSRDGKHFAFGYAAGKRSGVAIDDTKTKTYEKVYGLSLKPDGQVIFGARDAGKDVIVEDGKETEVDYLFKGAVYSGDGKRAAFHGVRNGREFIVLDGKEETGYDKVAEASFSFDGKHCAYAAKKADAQLVIIDSKEFPVGADYMLLSVRFSPSSDRVAVAYLKKGEVLAEVFPVR